VKEDKTGRACSIMGMRKKAYRVLVRKLERKRLVGKPRHKSENNIKIDFRERGWGGLEWIRLIQYRDQWRVCVSTVFNFWVP
jgi:hypothetical protein